VLPPHKKKPSWSADEQLFVSPVVSKVFKVTNFSDKLWSLLLLLLHRAFR
jgi:hypothetical protein